MEAGGYPKVMPLWGRMLSARDESYERGIRCFDQGRYEDAVKVAPPRRLEQKEFGDVPAVSVEEVAAYVNEAARFSVPFKGTAGMHAAVRCSSAWAGPMRCRMCNWRAPTPCAPAGRRIREPILCPRTTDWGWR